MEKRWCVHTRDHGGFRYTLHVTLTPVQIYRIYIWRYIINPVHPPPTTLSISPKYLIFHNLQTQRMETSEEARSSNSNQHTSLLYLYFSIPQVSTCPCYVQIRGVGPCPGLGWFGLGWCWADGGDGALSLCWCQLTAVRHGPGPAEDQTHGELDTDFSKYLW